MKFLCLISAEKVMETMTPAEAADQFRQYSEFTDELRRTGRFVAANRLLPRDTSTTVRVRDGNTIITDGPFAETKEQIGGYYIIDVPSIEDAIQVASKIPGARYGSVEVRPIADDPQTRALDFDEATKKQ